jgi:hypothetical protein
MNDALPTAAVSGYEDLIPIVSLPDADDRHVVAAAMASGASVILTWNLRDFAAVALKKYGLRRQTPDAFLATLYDQAPDLVVGSLANARRNLNKSRVSASDFVDILNNQNLGQLARRVRSGSHFGLTRCRNVMAGSSPAMTLRGEHASAKVRIAGACAGGWPIYEAER